jgi:hypothetical protein
MPGHEPTVPAQQRGRGDDPMVPELTRQSTDQGGQDGPVRPGQAWRADLATENGNFVTQHQQFGKDRGLAPR